MSGAPPAEDPRTVRDLLLSAGAVRFGRFVLTSGQESDVYVDIKRVSTRPERLAPIARALAARLRGEELLAGMELGAVPLLVAVSLATGRPFVIVRKPGRAHGTERRIEGEVTPSVPTLLLEDVTTTGGSLLDAIGLLRAAGARVERAVSVVDREQGAAAQLAAAGVRLESLATLSELRA